MLFPHVRVFTLVTLGFFYTTVALPAWVMLIYWMGLQFLGTLARAGGEGGGVAFWAHIGGFVAGVILAKLFARRDALGRIASTTGARGDKSRGSENRIGTQVPGTHTQVPRGRFPLR